MKYYSDILILATKLHYGQIRKDGITPFICHPINVSMQVKNIIDEYTDKTEYDYIPVYSALLHDTVEDTEITTNELYYNLYSVMMKMPNYYNKYQRHDLTAIITRVVNNVLILTRQKYKGLNRHCINEIYLKNVMSGGYEPILIKLCDRINNINSLNTIDNEEFKMLYITETEELIEKMSKWASTHQYDENVLYEGIVCKIDELEKLI